MSRRTECRRTSFHYGLFLLIFGLATSADANVNVIGGTASFGVDFGCAPVLGQSPSNFTSNVFYDEADVTVRPVGSTNNWHGWGAVSWNVSVGENARIIASGGSKEGFNNATCTLQNGGTGWLYGRGHGDFSVTFSLDRDYLYTSTVSGTVSGISNGGGMLQAGTHTITGQSIGNLGGFSLDISLTPNQHSTCQSVLSGAVTTQIGDAKKTSDGSGNPIPGVVMQATFRPNGVTIAEAAALCGFHHFNWYQRVTGITQFTKEYPTGKHIGVSILDPPLGGNGGDADMLPFYLDETQDPNFLPGFHLNDHQDAETLTFEDTPRDESLNPSNPEHYMAFSTSLVGVVVDENGMWKAWDILYTWTWKSNFNLKDGGVFYRTPRYFDGINVTEFSGGIFGLTLGVNLDEMAINLRQNMVNDGARNVPHLIVPIDIKPKSFPNSINLGSGGVVPVAILSTPAFSASTTDPTTVTLANASVKLKGKGTPMVETEDSNGDGLLDLLVHVSTEAFQLSQTDTEATLVGQTFDGRIIKGTDTIRIVP